MTGYTVKMLDRAAETHNAVYYNEESAREFFNQAASNGKHVGGEIVTNGLFSKQVEFFGMVDDETDTKAAQKKLRKILKDSGENVLTITR